MNTRPAIIPEMAPYLLTLVEKIPKNIAGNRDAAANPNAKATTSATQPGGSKPRYPAIMIAIAAAILPAMSSLFSDIFGITTPLIMSCEIDDDITNNKPAAVDNAAAIPPAATKAMTQFGKPAISGLASTIISLSTFNSLPCQPYSNACSI